MTSAEAHQGPNSPEEEGSPLPALLASGAIIAIFALIIFWPDSDEARQDGRAGVNAAHQSAAQGDKPRASRRAVASIEDRAMDKPGSSPGQAKVNPALGPVIRGMAPPLPPEEIPEFANKAEEIAYWERKLEVAKRMLADRATFVKRLDNIVANAPTNESREIAESRRTTVESNYAKAKKKVEDIESRLAGLRGG